MNDNSKPPDPKGWSTDYRGVTIKCKLDRSAFYFRVEVSPGEWRTFKDPNMPGIKAAVDGYLRMKEKGA